MRPGYPPEVDSIRNHNYICRLCPAHSMTARGQKPLLPYLRFGTAQMRIRTGRSRVEYLSHLRGIVDQRPWETDVP